MNSSLQLSPRGGQGGGCDGPGPGRAEARDRGLGRNAGVSAAALNISSVPGDRPVWPPDDHPLPSAVLCGERQADQVGCTHPSPPRWVPSQGERLAGEHPGVPLAPAPLAGAARCCSRTQKLSPSVWAVCGWVPGAGGDTAPSQRGGSVFGGLGALAFRVLSQLNPRHSLILIHRVPAAGWELEVPFQGKNDFQGLGRLGT